MVAATRTFPAPSTTPPPGPNGEASTEQLKANFEFLSGAVINQVTLGGGSTANNIVGSCSPALIAAPGHGQTFRLTPAANNTTAMTVDLGQGGAIALRDENDVALAADAIVSGRPILFYKDNVTGRYRLCGATMLGLIAAMTAAMTAAAWIEKIGDTTVSSPVANVEHIFTANAYQQLLCFANGASGTINGALQVDLRYGSGSILTAATASVNAANSYTADARFTLDVHTVGSRFHYVVLSPDAPGTAVSATSANTPDRVRWTIGGNIDAGRFITYGVKKP